MEERFPQCPHQELFSFSSRSVQRVTVAVHSKIFTVVIRTVDRRLLLCPNQRKAGLRKRMKTFLPRNVSWQNLGMHCLRCPVCGDSVQFTLPPTTRRVGTWTEVRKATICKRRTGDEGGKRRGPESTKRVAHFSSADKSACDDAGKPISAQATSYCALEKAHYMCIHS